MSYKQTVVCYFDILGFKDQITARRLCKQIIDLFNFINNFLKKNKDIIKRRSGIPIKIAICSDSVLIFSQSKKIIIAAKEIIKCVQLLQIDLLYNFGVLIRGGITIGDMHYKKSQFGCDLFGPAFQEAIKLESSVNPKISVSSEMISLFPESDQIYVNEYLLSNTNDKWHIKHFSNINNIWQDDLIYKIARNISIESQCKTTDKCNAEGTNEYRGHTKQCEENIYTNKWIYIREEFKNFCEQNGKINIWQAGHSSVFE